MGNRFFRGRRHPIEERYTKPQRIDRQLSNVDYKKLKKLIISQKLAPCFDALEDSNSNSDLEECPICFSFYPSLNRSRCCSKGICTECFLQMTPSDALRSTQCPFCKSSNYAVEYRGSRTQEEKGQEQAEEQKVIEAKIRMQYKESQTTDQVNASNERLCPVEVQYQTEDSLHQTEGWMHDVGNSNLSLHGRGIEVSQFPFPNAFSQRHVEFGLHADEVMLMEAIWQSIQDNCIQSSSQEISDSYGVAGSQIQAYGSNQGFPYQAMIGNGEVPSPNSVTGGVASVIANLAQSNMLQSETFHSINDNVQTSQIHDEHFIDSQHNNFQPTLPVDAGMLQMRIQCPPNSEFYEATSENDCLASCSSTEDGSWDSLSYHVPEGSQGSQDKFVSDLVKEEDLYDTSSCSSVHTISDVSCGSPHRSDMYEGQSMLSSPIAVAKHQCSFAGHLL